MGNKSNANVSKKKCRCPANGPHKHGAKKRLEKQPPAKLQTSMALLVDCSGSMDVHLDRTYQVVNRVIQTAREKDPTTHVLVLRFGSGVDSDVISGPASSVKDLVRDDLNRPRLKSSTSLFDAVIDATQRLEPHVDPNRSYLVTVITDGEDNNSRCSATELTRKMAGRVATDRWTFAFMLPPGTAASFVRHHGVPAGNCTEWSDIEKAGTQLDEGLQRFFTERDTERRTSTRDFFTTNLAAIKDSDLIRLPDVSSQYRWLTVDKEQDITSFVTAATGSYVKGTAFYALTKPEDVQLHKELLIVKKGTRTIRSNCRGLLGLPAAGIVRVTPGNHGDLDLYVQSTSPNRKLVRGTKLLVRR